MNHTPLPMILASCLVLAACAAKGKATPEPIVVVKEVKVPIAVPCVPPGLPGEPEYVDTDKALRAAAGPEDRYQILAAGREQRKARAGEVEPVITLCRK